MKKIVTPKVSLKKRNLKKRIKKSISQVLSFLLVFQLFSPILTYARDNEQEAENQKQIQQQMEEQIEKQQEESDQDQEDQAKSQEEQKDDNNNQKEEKEKEKEDPKPNDQKDQNNQEKADSLKQEKEEQIKQKDQSDPKENSPKIDDQKASDNKQEKTSKPNEALDEQKNQNKQKFTEPQKEVLPKEDIQKIKDTKSSEEETESSQDNQEEEAGNFDEKKAPEKESEEEKQDEKLWVANKDGSITTKNPVSIDVKYEYKNSGFSIQFSRIEEPGKITIREFYPKEELQAVGGKAWEVTSTMPNGSFKYDLELPYQEDQDVEDEEALEVVYSEAKKDYESYEKTDFKEVDRVKEIEEHKKRIIIKDLDHFTIFLITNPEAVYTGSPWTQQPDRGFKDGTVHYPEFSNGGETATWNFDSIDPGIYQVYISWTTNDNRTQNAPYTLNYQGGSYSFDVNQEDMADGSASPADGTWSGWYEISGGPYNLSTASNLVLTTLANAGSDYVIADEVLLVEVDIKPDHYGYNENNGSGDDYATPRPGVEIPCAGTTNVNSVSVHWSDVSGGNPLIKYQRQYMRPGSSSWQGNEIYSNPYTDFRTFGGAGGVEGEYKTRVRAFLDADDNDILDADEAVAVSDWSDECAITYDADYLEAPENLGWNRQDQSSTYDEGYPGPLDVPCPVSGSAYFDGTVGAANVWEAVSGKDIRYIRHNIRPNGSEILLGQSHRVDSSVSGFDSNDLNFIADNLTDSYVYNHSNGWGSFGSTEGEYITRVRAFEDSNSSGSYDFGEPISDWSNSCSSTYITTFGFLQGRTFIDLNNNGLLLSADGDWYGGDTGSDGAGMEDGFTARVYKDDGSGNFLAFPDSSSNEITTSNTGNPGQYKFENLPATGIYYVCGVNRSGYTINMPAVGQNTVDTSGSSVSGYAQGQVVNNNSGQADEADRCWKVELDSGLSEGTYLGIPFSPLGSIHVKSYQCPAGVGASITDPATKNNFKPNDSGNTTEDLNALGCSLVDGYRIGHLGINITSPVPSGGESGQGIGVTGDTSTGLLSTDILEGDYIFGELDSSDVWVNESDVLGFACNGSNPAGFRDNNAELATISNSQDVYCNLYKEITAIPVITVDSLITNDKTPKLSGTVDDPTASIEITVNGSTYTAVNNGDGTWTLADDTVSVLVDGVYDVEATATNTSGISGNDSTTDELTIDTVSPSPTAWHSNMTPNFITRLGDQSGGKVEMQFNKNPDADVDYYQYQYRSANLDGTSAGEGLITMTGVTCDASDICTWTPTFNDGRINIHRFRAVDKAGNLGAWSNWNNVTDNNFRIINPDDFKYEDFVNATGVFDTGVYNYIESYGGYGIREQVSPSSNITTALPTDPTKDPDITMDYTASDTDTAVKQVELSVSTDGGANFTSTGITSDTGSITYTASTDGEYCFYTQAQDIADDRKLDNGEGNFEDLTSKTCEYTVVVDLTIPDVSWNTPTDSRTINDTQTLSANCDGGTTESQYVNFWWWNSANQTVNDAQNNGQYHYVRRSDPSTGTVSGNDFSWDLDTSSLDDGDWTLRAACKDEAGNYNHEEIAVVVDNTPPVVTVDSQITVDTTPQITGTVDDPTASIEITVNGSTYTAVNNGDGTWTLADDRISPDLAIDVYDVEVSAVDAVGNVGTDSTTDELKIVSPAAPSVSPIPTPTPSPEFTPNSMPSVVSYDLAIELGHGYYYVDDRDVLLEIYPPQDFEPVQMIISENEDFSGASWQPYQSQYWWYLDGDRDDRKVVYVKLKDVYGRQTDVAINHIILVEKGDERAQNDDDDDDDDDDDGGTTTITISPSYSGSSSDYSYSDSTTASGEGSSDNSESNEQDQGDSSQQEGEGEDQDDGEEQEEEDGQDDSEIEEKYGSAAGQDDQEEPGDQNQKSLLGSIFWPESTAGKVFSFLIIAAALGGLILLAKRKKDEGEI
ncbi:MAG: hypothetical protein GF335_01255 [Candidatus Moranbacteria bacterium]|nr:hypothetical protein [Candidatus Moranbacteria bacterium]